MAAFKRSILAMEKHEIFDLVEACYTYAILWHSGQFSDLYALQCEISQHYTAGMGYSESYVEENNEFYHDLDDENVFQVWSRCLYVLENRWNEE